MGQVRPIVPHRLTSLAQRDYVGGETPGSRATRRGRRTPRHVRLPSDLRRVVDRGGSPAPLPAASARGASTARKRTRSPIGSSAWIHRARGGLPFRPIGRDMCFEASADRLTLGICASSLSLAASNLRGVCRRHVPPTARLADPAATERVAHAPERGMLAWERTPLFDSSARPSLDLGRV